MTFEFVKICQNLEFLQNPNCKYEQFVFGALKTIKIEILNLEYILTIPKDTFQIQVRTLYFLFNVYLYLFAKISSVLMIVQSQTGEKMSFIKRSNFKNEELEQ